MAMLGTPRTPRGDAKQPTCAQKTWRQLTLPFSYPSHSLYWKEKALMVFDFLQLYGLLLAFSQAWPWPLRWRRAMSWTLIFNLDIPTMVRLQKELSASAVEVASTSLWGHLDNFFLLPFVFACLLVGTFITYHALVNLAYHRFWDVLNVRAFMREVVWWNGQLLYLPVTLAASRALACETFTIGQYQGQSRVAVDPNLECGGVGHTLLLVLCVPLLVIWGVGVPAGIAWHVSSSLVFPPSKPHRHERFLRWKESEYAFGITVDWRREHMWMFSSFVRRWWHPYNRAIWYSMLGLLVLLHALMRSMPEMQVNFFFALVFAWTLRMVLLPAYRVGTSSALCLVIWSAASFNAIYSVIRANGVVSALTIDSEYFAFM